MSDPNWEHEFSRFLDTLGYQIDAPSALRLDGKGHGIKCYDKEHKGKTYYIGAWKETKAGQRYPTITVRSHAHGGLTLDYFNGFDILKGDHVYTPAPLTHAPKRANDNEDARKAANVKHDIESFAHLSKIPTDNQQALYLINKQIDDKLDGLDVRYGTDKHGHYAAILLTDAKIGKAKGVQRFYDRKIKDGTNTR